MNKLSVIQFDAEVIKVEVKKTVSMDRLYRVVLETNQPAVLQLEKYIAEDTVKVEVKDGK